MIYDYIKLYIIYIIYTYYGIWLYLYLVVVGTNTRFSSKKIYQKGVNGGSVSPTYWPKLLEWWRCATENPPWLPVFLYAWKLTDSWRFHKQTNPQKWLFETALPPYVRWCDIMVEQSISLNRWFQVWHSWFSSSKKNIWLRLLRMECSLNKISRGNTTDVFFENFQVFPQQMGQVFGHGLSNKWWVPTPGGFKHRPPTSHGVISISEWEQPLRVMSMNVIDYKCQSWINNTPRFHSGVPLKYQVMNIGKYPLISELWLVLWNILLSFFRLVIPSSQLTNSHFLESFSTTNPSYKTQTSIVNIVLVVPQIVSGYSMVY